MCITVTVSSLKTSGFEAEFNTFGVYGGLPKCKIRAKQLKTSACSYFLVKVPDEKNIYYILLGFLGPISTDLIHIRVSFPLSIQHITLE